VSPATSTLPAVSSYPNIPVLAVSGDFDLRTPTSGARAVVSRFPHGHLLEVANTGHSVLTTSLSTCVARSIRSWLAGREITQACAAPRPIDPLGPFPSITRRATQAAKRTASVQQVANTVHEAEAAWLLAMSEGGWQFTSVPGLASGRLTGGVQGFTLTRYGIGNGLVLTGTVHTRLKYDHPLAFDGVLHVGGQGATHTGTVYFGGNRLVGTLDHKVVDN